MTFHKHLNPIYLAKKKKKEFDRLAYIVIGLTFLITLPQVYQIYDTQSAEDISIISYVGFTLISVFWIIYGLKRQSHVITISSLIHLGVNIAIVKGILEYGNVL